MERKTSAVGTRWQLSSRNERGPRVAGWRGGFVGETFARVGVGRLCIRGLPQDRASVACQATYRGDLFPRTRTATIVQSATGPDFVLLGVNLHCVRVSLAASTIAGTTPFPLDPSPSSRLE